MTLCVMCSQNNLHGQQAAHHLLCEVRFCHNGEEIKVASDGWVVNDEGDIFRCLSGTNLTKNQFPHDCVYQTVVIGDVYVCDLEVCKRVRCERNVS